MMTSSNYLLSLATTLRLLMVKKQNSVSRSSIMVQPQERQLLSSTHLLGADLIRAKEGRKMGLEKVR